MAAAKVPQTRLHPATFVSVVVILLAAFAFVGAVRSASSALLTVIIGAVLGLALDPVVRSLQRRLGCPRPVAIALVLAAVALLVSLVVVLMAPRAIDQARRLSSDIPSTVRAFYDLPLLGHWLSSNDAAGKVDQAMQDLPGGISDESVSRTLEALFGGAITALVVLAIMVAVLLDGSRIVAAVRRRLPPEWLDEADTIGRIAYRATAQYFGGSLTVAGLMGVFVLALCLIFGVPLAPLAAVWAMLTSLIPQIGGFLGGVLVGILALTQGPVVFLIVVGLFVLYMNLENHVISPAIVGKAVDVTPPTTMLAALIGASVAGVPGALIATPLAGATKQAYVQLRTRGSGLGEGKSVR